MKWDRQAIVSGGSVALVFAVPFSIGARLAADGDNSSLAVWLSLGAVVGFTLGAGCASWTQRTGSPLSHGLVTAAGTYLAAQAVFVLIRLVRSDSVRWFGIFFNLSVVMMAGLLGGFLGQRMRGRGLLPQHERRQPSP